MFLSGGLLDLLVLDKVKDNPAGWIPCDRIKIDPQHHDAFS
jgi:hypothetical protein